MYSTGALILLSDYTDVVFQSNPFTYKTKQWTPPRYDLAVFQEAFPNNMIYRSPYNSRWRQSCYTDEVYEEIAYNPVSCSGTTMGTRDAILVYVSESCLVCVV